MFIVYEKLKKFNEFAQIWEYQIWFFVWRDSSVIKLENVPNGRAVVLWSATDMFYQQRIVQDIQLSKLTIF